MKENYRIFVLFFLVLCFCSLSMEGTKMNSIYDFTMTDIDGKEVSLLTFKGKLVMIVNVASKCGFTRQYKGLQEIYSRYKDQGFVILGFPANNFLGQEPGSDSKPAATWAPDRVRTGPSSSSAARAPSGSSPRVRCVCIGRRSTG